jgi:hypothetical protein
VVFQKPKYRLVNGPYRLANFNLPVFGYPNDRGINDIAVAFPQSVDVAIMAE